jgi:hypothetical protein
MKDAHVHLRIDELVLHGFAPGDGTAVASALREQLSTLFRTEGVPDALREAGHTQHLTGVDMSATATSDPVAAGQGVATAIYRSWSR